MSASPPADFYSPDSYSQEESVLHLMRRIMAVTIPTIESEIPQPNGPTQPQWLALHKLQQGQVTQVVELARACQLDPGAMTHLLDRLERKGLCRRERSPDDRRVVNVTLTQEGNEAACLLPHIFSKVQNQHLAGFSKLEWKELQGFLRRMLANAEAAASADASRPHPIRQPGNDT
jgi:DNA-binding MarR family transcriptional regulator